MKLEILKEDYKRCRFNPEFHTAAFPKWKEIPNYEGLYAIWQNDLCIYVGQGSGKLGIRGRMGHHWNKAFNSFKTKSGKNKGTKDTAGWSRARENPEWTPDIWIVEHFECPSAVSRTYLEGAMILTFDPLCNVESFEDRHKVGNRP